MRQGEGVRVAFLLVGEDLATGVERASGLETLISVNGGAFRPTAGEPEEVGAGWYVVDLTAEETATPGPLIFRALADEAAVEWRNLYEVEAAPVVDGEALAAAVAEAVAEAVADAVGDWALELRWPARLIRIGTA